MYQSSISIPNHKFQSPNTIPALRSQSPIPNSQSKSLILNFYFQIPNPNLKHHIIQSLTLIKIPRCQAPIPIPILKLQSKSPILIHDPNPQSLNLIPDHQSQSPISITIPNPKPQALIPNTESKSQT